MWTASRRTRASLRLAGELTELRGPDLRFSLDESRARLRADGITFSDIDVDHG